MQSASRATTPAPPSAATVADLAEQIGRASTLAARIAIIVRAVPGRIAFSTSLGLEDQAVLDAIAEATGANSTTIDVFTLDTGRHFPETLDTIVASEQRYGRRIRVVFPDTADVEQLVAADGLNGFRLSIEARKACCDVRKVRPLRRALTGASGWITGLRRGQSGGRAEVPFAEIDAGLGLLKLNPLADWSLDQLEAYVADRQVPLNALHAQGFPSIGCQPCTRAVSPGEDIRAGRWSWEQADGRECGLHNRPKHLQPQPAADDTNSAITLAAKVTA